MQIKQLLLDEYNKRYGSEIRKYKIGEYHVSSLLGSCLKATWNHFQMKKLTKEHIDSTKLIFFKGILFHEMVQKSKAWDGVEVECVKKIKTSHGTATLLGHADAVKDDAVFELKTCAYIPRRPKFDHICQVNAYMHMLGKPRGVIVYAGSDGEKFDIKEYQVVQSDWHYQHMINRLMTLHAILKTAGEPICSCRNRQHDIEWLTYKELHKL